MIHSGVLLLPACWHEVVPSDCLPIWSILNHFAVELVAGVSCTDLSHKRTCICDHYRKREKETRQKEQHWKSNDWGRTQKVEKKLTFSPLGFLQ
jgi:hypothetical protein